MIFSYVFPTGEISIDLSLHLSILSIYLSVFKLNDLWIFYNLRWKSHIIAILLDDFSRNCKKKANGMNYYGKTNVTKSGSPCNYWAETSQKATSTRIWRTSSTIEKPIWWWQKAMVLFRYNLGLLWHTDVLLITRYL